MNTTTTTTVEYLRTATTLESVPATWVADRDEAFFRMTSDLFGHDFTYGAGVLLASYDEDES